MKRRALAGHAFQRNASSMSEDDIFDDREAEAGAAGVARAVFVDAVESLENVGLVLERDARAVVGKSELDAFADTLGCEVDFQGGDLAVLKRVEEQVRANLLDAARVDLRMPRILRPIQDDLGRALFDFWSKVFDDPRDQRGQVGVGEMQKPRAVFHARDREEILEEQGESLDIPVDGLERF